MKGTVRITPPPKDRSGAFAKVELVEPDKDPVLLLGVTKIEITILPDKPTEARITIFNPELASKIWIEDKDIIEIEKGEK